MTSTTALVSENESPYQVESRREIIALLRNLQESNQLITMLINEGSEVVITAILKVDDVNNTLVLDSAASDSTSQRVVSGKRVFFEAALNKISIKFSSNSLSLSNYSGRPSFSCPIPTTMIRLQRRENYRIVTPVTNPIYCVVTLLEEDGGGTVKLPLSDISCGGVSLMDEKHKLSTEFGTIYANSKIDLPGLGMVSVNLQVRNSQNLELKNDKVSRRIGFQFIDLPNPVMSQIQKLITKIERERNSRQTGLGS